MAHAEVRLDDGLVLLDGVRLAVGDALAVVEHRHPVAEAHDQFDVVLDEQDGDARVADAADAVDQVLPLGRVHAGGRLVEQQQSRLGGQGAGDLHQPLLPVGQAGGRRVRRAVQADEPQRVHGAQPGGLLLAALPGQAEAAGDEPGLLVPVAADEDVLEHVHVLEDAQVLEGAGHAQAGAGRRRLVRDVLAGRGTRGPRTARCSRLMTLNSVVLPAPFGPMRATICPVRTVMVTSLTARSPPKSTETPSTLSSSSPFVAGVAPSSAMSVPESGLGRGRVPAVLGHVGRQRDLRLAGADGALGLHLGGARDRLGAALPAERVLDAHQPLLGEQAGDAHRQEQQEEDHDDRVDDAAPLLRAGEAVGDPRHEHGAHEAAPDGPAAADQHHDDRQDGGAERERRRA